MVRIVFRFNFIGFSFGNNLLKYHAFHINRTYLNYNFAEKHLSRMHDGSGKEHAVPGGERKAGKRSEKTGEKLPSLRLQLSQVWW